MAGLVALLLVAGVVALVVWQPWQAWFPAAVEEPAPAPASTDAVTPVPDPTADDDVSGVGVLITGSVVTAGAARGLFGKDAQ